MQRAMVIIGLFLAGKVFCPFVFSAQSPETFSQIKDKVPAEIQSFFNPPIEFERDLGQYRPSLRFDDGTQVKTPQDWEKRRQEIIKTWQNFLGVWPPLITNPKIEYQAKSHRDNFIQHQVRVEIAPDHQMVNGYLLIPDGKGPFPAVLVVYYDAETGVGLGKENRDFGYQLAKRGFVILSIGTPAFCNLEPPYKPLYDSGNSTPLQPLSALAYVAANCHTALVQLPEVDKDRIGIMGHSYGGKWAMFASCLYEKFACAVWSDPGIVFDESRPNVNYWEPWYLGWETGKQRERGIPSDSNPRTGPYRILIEKGYDLHELHVLMAPRPFLVSGGSEDPPERWKALNHTVAVNRILGYTSRVAMTNRIGHDPTPESNSQIYSFLEYFLKDRKALFVSSLTAAADQSQTITPLGELDPIVAHQGWGQLTIDRSVWDKPMQIGDRKFSAGLGTHANSELTYDLEQAYDLFQAWVGVDAGVVTHPEASVIFKVFVDRRELFDSGVMRADTPAQKVSVSVTGASELKLVVTDAGDGISADHADWAEAVLIGKPRTSVPIPPPLPGTYRIRSTGLEVELSDQGEIVAVSIGNTGLRIPLRGGTALARCTNSSAISVTHLSGGGAVFTRQVVHEPSGQKASLTERLLPGKDSIRWEIEIRGEGEPWSTGIKTQLRWPAADTTRFWTAWEDPEQKRDIWRDPLVLRPLVNKRLWYGASRWDEEQPQAGYQPTRGDGFVIPLLTLAEPEHDAAISLVLSPEDTLLEMTLKVGKDGSFAFTRNDHRISKTNTVRFAMDLVGHAADWRGGLGWMTRRYPEYFNPPNPRARDIVGLGAYSDWEGDLDTDNLKRMGFRVNWKASYDFPYMGMFLPPIPNDEKYTRLVKNNSTSIAQLRDYSARMRRMGFHVLNYFNVTEFGATTGMPSQADPSLASQDRWKNVRNFMRDEVSDGILLDLQGRPYPSWEGCVAMDCGGPKYRAFLLDQARRHIEKLPDSSGICIDRLDWLRYYNLHADDGLSWRRNGPCRSLYTSWRSLLAEMGPLFHAADKIILVNAMVNRTELLRHVDGIYHEFGHIPADLNGAAIQCVRKPCIAWTPDENTLKSDPDAYFQRHLYLGVFPTAPLPANDHTIAPSNWADRWYLDYGPLFDSLRGRTWVLVPHAIEVQGLTAKANLFEVPGGFLVPVMFGEKDSVVTVKLAKLENLVLGKTVIRCEMIIPGSDKWITLPPRIQDGRLVLEIPLHRHCAMVRITRSS